MLNNALLKNTSIRNDSPHDTTRKPIDRRHVRKGPRTPEESLRVLAHYQGLLIELLNEKAANGNA
jgi:hypothetical protein